MKTPIRLVKTKVSVSNFNESVANLLYATRVIKPTEELLSLDLGKIEDGLIELKLRVRKE